MLGTFGDQNIRKQVGGDIIENKKSYYLNVLKQGCPAKSCGYVTTLAKDPSARLKYIKGIFFWKAGRRLRTAIASIIL
jgi:hypothetical protein